MASMRRVRKDFRKEVLRLVSTGDGDIETLTHLAGRFFGHEVGYEVLIKTFLGSEVSNAVSCLRAEGFIETIGKQWKPVTELKGEDVDIISIRRLKRLRGELKSEIQLAHKHGRVDEAIAASRMLEIVSQQLKGSESHEPLAESKLEPVTV